MNSVLSNTVNELQKLFLKKKTIVFLIITAIVSFLSAFFISSIQAKLIFIALDAFSFPMIILSIFTNIILPLFIFMAAAELFSGEIADRTLKLVLIRPISRLKIFVSKVLAIGIYVIINLLVVFLVSTISSLVLKINIASISSVAFSYFVDIIPALILVIFSVFIMQFFRSSSAAVISSILIFIGIRVLSIFSNSFNNIMFTSYLDWHSLWLSAWSNPLRIINILFMVLAYGIILFTLGYYLFDKKEV